MRISIATLVVLLAAASIGAQRQDAIAPGIDDVRRQFADPPADSRVMMRWWWFGPSLSRDELDLEMRQMTRRRHRRLRSGDGLPARHRRSTRTASATMRTCRRRFWTQCASPRHARANSACAWTSRSAAAGRSADLTSRPAIASTRLRSERRESQRASPASHVPQSFEGDRLIAAFVGRGSGQEADPATYRELPLGGGGRAAAAARCRTARRAVLFHRPDRPGREARGGSAPTATCSITTIAPRSTRICATVGDKLLGAAGRGRSRTRCSATASRCTTRIGRRTCSTSSASAAATICGRYLPLAELGGGERGRRGPPRLRPDADRAVRGALPRRRCTTWARAHGTRFRIADLRHAAGHARPAAASPICPTAKARVADALGDALGVVGRASLRQAGRPRPRPGRGCTRPRSAPRRST